LNAHTELRAKRQRSAREAIYRNRPIRETRVADVASTMHENLLIVPPVSILTAMMLVSTYKQGLILVRFSAQPKPFLAQNTP